MTPLAKHVQALRRDAAEPSPLPADATAFEKVRYGFAQPLLGLRVVVRSTELLGMALAPAIGVLLIGIVVGYSAAQEHGFVRGVAAGWLAVVALAPLPAVLFGRVYAHLAAKSRPSLGLPPQGPYLRGVFQLCGEWIAQVVILALGVLPLTLVLGIMPLVGAVLALTVQGLWALHWVVIEGYDNARTLPDGCTVEELEARGRTCPGDPWFHRFHSTMTGPKWLISLLGPVRMVSEVINSLARAWRIEVDTAERHPWVSLGFGLSVMMLVAIPGVNLFFRAAAVVGGVHLRHQLFDEPRPVIVERGHTAPQQIVSG